MLGQLSPKPAMYCRQQVKIARLESDLRAVRQLGINDCYARGASLQLLQSGHFRPMQSGWIGIVSALKARRFVSKMEPYLPDLGRVAPLFRDDTLDAARSRHSENVHSPAEVKWHDRVRHRVHMLLRRLSEGATGAARDQASSGADEHHSLTRPAPVVIPNEQCAARPE